MGRGDDQRKTPAVLRKSNPFLQKIEEIDHEELAEYRQEREERLREQRLEEARAQEENIAVPEEAAALASTPIFPEAAMKARNQYVMGELFKFPSGDSLAHFIAKMGGFIKEDYQVEITSRRGELVSRIHCPQIKEENRGHFSFEANWELVEEKTFLPGEEKQAKKEIENYIQSQIKEVRQRAEEAIAVQDKLKKIFSKEGLMSSDPNSPAYGLLDQAGKEVFADCPLMPGAYRQDEFNYQFAGNKSPVLNFLPEHYQVHINEGNVGAGTTYFWYVTSPDGQGVASGRDATQGGCKEAAEVAIKESAEDSLQAVRKEHARFKKREEVFQGLNARVLVRGMSSAHSQEYINLASANKAIKNLKRKDLGDGWTAVVGEQTFNFGPPKDGGGFKQKDGELLLLFKDGELQHKYNEGLTSYSDDISGRVGRLFPGLRKRLLLASAKERIKKSPGFRGRLADM